MGHQDSPFEEGGKKGKTLTRKFLLFSSVLASIISGCRPTTQPKTGDSILKNALTLQTDSSQYHTSTLWSAIRMTVHNGTDSIVVFPACEIISMRIDTLKQQRWALGTPGWEQVCPSIYDVSWLLKPDSTYNLKFFIKGPATFRIVTIYSGISQVGNPYDTLASNTFTVVTGFLPPSSHSPQTANQ